MNAVIMKAAKQRGITRLCHFTPSRNLVHIASGKTGILATRHLKEDERNVYTATDLQRLDRHDTHICCSVEYPNAWYFDKARSSETIFKDWVILVIRSSYLWEDGTLFCPRNAASSYGTGVAGGEVAFNALFASSVKGAHNEVYLRSAERLACCPTDEQAEVLILDRVPLTDVVAIVVSSESQAKNEVARLCYAGVPTGKLKFIVSPTLFDKNELSRYIREGRRPLETDWPLGE